jgi:hypothetical protein
LKRQLEAAEALKLQLEAAEALKQQLEAGDALKENLESAEALTNKLEASKQQMDAFEVLKQPSEDLKASKPQVEPAEAVERQLEAAEALKPSLDTGTAAVRDQSENAVKPLEIGSDTSFLEASYVVNEQNTVREGQLLCQLCNIVAVTRLQLLEHYSGQHLTQELTHLFSDLGICLEAV